jgi:type I restriction enzyme S subunit
MKDWQIKKLGEVVDVFDNLRKPINSTERLKRISGKNTKDLFPYYGATGQVGWIDSYLIEGEFILVGEDGAPFLDNYKSKAYKIFGKTWVNNHAHILKEKENLTLNSFILYYLNSIDYRQYVNGTTRLKLTKGSLSDIPFPLPPLETQHAIVSKIEELFSELDKGIAELKTAQLQLKTYRQSVLKSAFEGKLTNENVKDGELPDGWQWKTFNEIIEISKEKHKPVINEFKFYIGLEHIEKNIGKLTSHCGIEEIKTIKNKFKSGEILYGKLRPNLNKVYLTREEGVCSTDILVLKTRKNCNAKFLTQLMLGSDFVNTMSENTNGVNLPRVSTKFILEYKINLPPIEEQHQIVQEIESRLSVADKMEQSIQESLQKAEALRQSILKKAFCGELL